MRHRTNAWKPLALAVVAALALLAAGCAKKAVKTPPEPPPAPPAQTQAPPTPKEPEQPPTPPPAPTPEMTASDLQPVFFDFDSYTLRDDARSTLDADARMLREHPLSKITIEGHCDERGTVEYNQALGERRAQAVHDYLVQAGIPEARLQVISYGKERPFDNGHDEAAWAKNRRAHFALQ